MDGISIFFVERVRHSHVSPYGPGPGRGLPIAVGLVRETTAFGALSGCRFCVDDPNRPIGSTIESVGEDALNGRGGQTTSPAMGT